MGAGTAVARRAVPPAPTFPFRESGTRHLISYMPAMAGIVIDNDRS